MLAIVGAAGCAQVFGVSEGTPDPSVQGGVGGGTSGTGGAPKGGAPGAGATGGATSTGGNTGTGGKGGGAGASGGSGQGTGGGGMGAVGGSGGSAPFCDTMSGPSCGSCTGCVKGTTCQPQWQKCQMDSECVAIDSCNQTCANGDFNCHKNCFLGHGPGQSDYFAFGTCVACQGCPSTCGSSGFLCGGPGGAGGAPGCAHDVCTFGGPLSPGCDPCVTKVCASNPQCCVFGAWDASCVSTANALCGSMCGSGGAGGVTTGGPGGGPGGSGNGGAAGSAPACVTMSFGSSSLCKTQDGPGNCSNCQACAVAPGGPCKVQNDTCNQSDCPAVSACVASCTNEGGALCAEACEAPPRTPAGVCNYENLSVCVAAACPTACEQPKQSPCDPMASITIQGTKYPSACVRMGHFVADGAVPTLDLCYSVAGTQVGPVFAPTNGNLALRYGDVTRFLTLPANVPVELWATSDGMCSKYGAGLTQTLASGVRYELAQTGPAPNPAASSLILNVAAQPPIGLNPPDVRFLNTILNTTVSLFISGQGAIGMAPPGQLLVTGTLPQDANHYIQVPAPPFDATISDSGGGALLSPQLLFPAPLSGVYTAYFVGLDGGVKPFSPRMILCDAGWDKGQYQYCRAF